VAIFRKCKYWGYLVKLAKKFYPHKNPSNPNINFWRSVKINLKNSDMPSMKYNTLRNYYICGV